MYLRIGVSSAEFIKELRMGKTRAIVFADDALRDQDVDPILQRGTLDVYGKRDFRGVIAGIFR